ncbi:WD repeat domain-containing protein [Stagonosporopsis vannaccii]|nr:WD repeat domain-containing protein [Stagonosporopsis vannaccii]
MSAPGLVVRCLATTSVVEARQETGQDGQNGAQSCDEVATHAATQELEEESGLSSDEERHDHAATLSIKNDDLGDNERATTPTPSASSGGSDSPSDIDTDSSITDSSDPLTFAKPNASTSCLQEAQLSPDGTCIFTSDYSRTFSVYPISPDILETNATQHLRPYAQFSSADPIWAFAANPLFNLQDPSSTHVLISRRDRYITLHNALWDISAPATSTQPQSSPVDIHSPLASYKLINHLTEAVTTPLSLAYSPAGTHFFAGTQNSISIFDLTHTDDPIHRIPTIPSARSKLKGGGRGFKGCISALAVSPPTASSTEGLLAAGARTRYVGIYDALSGSEVTHFSLPGTVDGRKLADAPLADVMGDGVSSLKWSPCGRYLYVAERASDVLLIYDVRKFALALGYCKGRDAGTKQKMGFDVWNAGASPYDVESVAHEVWAGGQDGRVRVWRDPYMKEGAVDADEVFDIGDGDAMPVVSTLVHSSGSLAVTARGMLHTGGDAGIGIARGGGIRPRFSERGCLDILGLSSY